MNTMPLDAERKNFLTTCYCLLILLVVDLVNFITSIIAGEYSTAMYAGAVGENILKGFLFFIMGAMICSFILQAYLCAKGIAEAKNPTKARSHIVLANFAGVVNAIVAIIAAVGLFDATRTANDVLNLVIALCDTIIMFAYAYEAKKVRAKAE